ncbi:HPr kinase/phosphatase C-terminal domain-containing protein [Sphingomonas sp. QA11]|uniref:HPr kinase/phosphorylase n=1 Tax=Sphingomonas sp. QA11 TaxID=2950605 RepID=UPI002349DD61|nr:HPr kinase/phosphatase C-terminal domain-containing protein [Sphingomonas sp. QA11]WCM28953.1 HPr kinase/phosphatase C-terminal domain-containing protein [Sphingomonas sp. QA11]
MSETIHASTVAIGGRAVLIEGPSGAGKSDLALRLIDRGGVLVSDDYTVLTPDDGVLTASAPATIAGRLEVRGIGIISVTHIERAPVTLLARLSTEVERMPEAESREIEGIAIPVIVIDPREASAPIKVELALGRLLERAP